MTGRNKQCANCNLEDAKKWLGACGECLYNPTIEASPTHVDRWLPNIELLNFLQDAEVALRADRLSRLERIEEAARVIVREENYANSIQAPNQDEYLTFVGRAISNLRAALNEGEPEGSDA